MSTEKDVGWALEQLLSRIRARLPEIAAAHVAGGASSDSRQGGINSVLSKWNSSLHNLKKIGYTKLTDVSASPSGVDATALPEVKQSPPKHLTARLVISSPVRLVSQRYFASDVSFCRCFREYQK